VRAAILTWCVLFCLAAQAQRREPDLQRLADELLPYQDEDLNYEELYENLVMLLAHPLDINRATAEQLRFLNLLTEAQVQQLLRYRQEYGPLLSLYELQQIEGFDRTTWERISPFVYVRPPGSATSLLAAPGNSYAIWRYTRTLQRKDGFTENVSNDQRFRGSGDAVYFRFRSAVTGQYSLGITAEKDAGEQLRWKPAQQHYGMDFISPHFQLINRGRLKNLIIGHYQAQVGQGLVLGGNFGFGKGGETVTTARRSNLGFMPYTSVNETGYLNGIATAVAITENLTLSPFYSHTWRDGSLAADSAEQTFVTSFRYTGLHRNAGELNLRKTISEQQYGAVVRYQHRQLDAGLVMHTLQFNTPLEPARYPYNQFAFRGASVTNTGFFLNYTFRNFAFFSEVAQSIGHGHGFVAGLLGSFSPNLEVAWLVRHFQPNFHSFYANAFAESSRAQNEQGIYYGWKYRLHKTLTFSGYADFFRFPWLRYRSYAPGAGHEWLLRLTYQPTRTIRLTAQHRQESKPRNESTAEGNLYPTSQGVKHNTWLIADYSVTSYLRMRTRAQFSRYQINNRTTRGMIMMQDLIYEHNRFSLTARYALFDTDDYDNRQYVFENDVWLAYTFPAWQDKGIRSYLLLEYKFSRAFTLWLRMAHTTYINRTAIGSGPDRISGPERSDIRLQLRLRF
jgi:hypothetical protein